MPISLIFTPFDHFQLRPASAVKCIPDLRVPLIKRKAWNELNCWVFMKDFVKSCWRLKTEMNPRSNKGGLESNFWLCSGASRHSIVNVSMVLQIYKKRTITDGCNQRSYTEVWKIMYPLISTMMFMKNLVFEDNV